MHDVTQGMPYRKLEWLLKPLCSGLRTLVFMRRFQSGRNPVKEL